MNATDYRIHSRKDLLRGVVKSLFTKDGTNYVSIELVDGRVLSYVRYSGTLAVGQRVLVRYDSGLWKVEG